MRNQRKWCNFMLFVHFKGHKSIRFVLLKREVVFFYRTAPLVSALFPFRESVCGLGQLLSSLVASDVYFRNECDVLEQGTSRRPITVATW